MDMEEDVVVIACGGAARNVFGINSKTENLWDLYHRSLEDFGHPFHVVSKFFNTLPFDNPDYVASILDGRRIVIPFSILGGELGTDVIKQTIEYARKSGCKVVSVLGIPMGFEPDRRERAFIALPEVAALSDCTLVLDLAKLMNTNMEIGKNRSWTVFLRMSDNIMTMSIKSIVEFMQGPFFTVFTEHMYSYVPASDVVPLNAVKNSWDTVMFDNFPLMNGSVIMVAANVRTSEIEDIQNEVVSKSGIMPEVVKREDSEDSKVLIFRAVRSF